MAFLRLIFLLLAFTSSFFCSSSDSGRKELRVKEVNWQNVVQLPRPVQSKRIDPSRVIQISWRPRVFLYQGFLSDEECDHLISLARGVEEEEETSGHQGNISVNKQISNFRTQLNKEDDILSSIDERISAWTFLPKENSRPLHVMRYGLEEAKPNVDYFGNKSTLDLNNPLMATVILYLSNVTRGGDLVLPDSEVNSKIGSDCAKTRKVLRPVKGNAILFFTLRLDASPDVHSSHTRCPVLQGEMWSAAKFFQVRAANDVEVSIGSDDSECTDEDENCPLWASIGECHRNSVYMIGSPDYYGTCRKSCHVC